MRGASPRARGLNSVDVLSMMAENHDYIQLRDGAAGGPENQPSGQSTV